MKQARLILLLGLLLLLALTLGTAVAQHGDGEDGHGGEVDATMPVVGPDVTLHFAAMVGSRPATCGLVYRGIGADGATISITDFRFFVSNIRLINAAGEEVPVELAQDGQWQYANVALLDFEDATSGCSEAGTPEMHDKVTGSVPEGAYTGVVFDLGVPFELNHLDTSAAPAPLNVPAMWWNWQFGYKFVRIDLLTPDGQTPAWFIHLGSTGCQAADSSTPPEAPCSNPNITTVRMDGFNPLENFIVADLAALVAGVNLNESTPQPPGCMSGLEDPDCGGLFTGFGLELATGLMVADGTQNFFRAE